MLRSQQILTRPRTGVPPCLLVARGPQWLQPAKWFQASTAPLQVEAEWYRKDANEVLLKDGPDMLRAFIENAEPLPIRGLLR